MIEELTILPRHIFEAEHRAAKLGVLSRSITQGERNVYGYLGQILIRERIGALEVDGFDYDLDKQGHTIDVKTEVCNSVPLPDYVATVAASSHRQKCEWYIFVSVMTDFSRAWSLGKILKSDYFKRATFYHKGDPSPLRHDGWLFKADCFNLPISELLPLK